MINNFISKQPSQLLFNRSWAFTLGKNKDTNALRFQNYASKDDSGKLIPASPLKITFSIEKNFIGTPNTTKFEIYNLSLETRSQIKAGDVLELKAGYNGLMDRIFFGQIGMASAKSVRNGSNIVTSFECLDGGGAIIMSRINKSYPPGTKLYQIVEDILKEMSLETDYNPVPIDSGLIMNLPDISYPRGITINSSCKDALNNLLKGQGLDWSVQNNSLVILPVGKSTNQTAIEIGPNSGLIGIPTRNGIYFEFKSLLNPQIKPGVVIKLVTDESTFNFNTQKNEALAGYYIVNVAKYKGDTYGADWTVECSCRAIQAKEINTNNNSISTGYDLSTAVKGQVIG
jgi:hypothetical protein